MLKIITFIWGLPQHLLALIILAFNKKKIIRVEKYKTATVYWLKDTRWGISLGEYIIVSSRYHDHVTVAHEYGHTVQNYILGPLYLLIIGVASGGQNRLSAWRIMDNSKYYQRWPESWADKLGGVERVGMIGRVK